MADARPLDRGNKGRCVIEHSMAGVAVRVDDTSGLVVHAPRVHLGL